MKNKELVILLNKNELTEALASLNNCLFAPKIRNVRKLPSTSNSITTETQNKLRSPSPSSSSEAVPSKRIKIISNILLRARQEDRESESCFIVERINAETPCDSFNTGKIEARENFETLQYNVLGEVDKIYRTEPTELSMKQTKVDYEDIPPQSQSYDIHPVETELKTLFKFSYFLFEKLLSPDTTKNEIRTVFKHSYFMFTNALTARGITEAYRDLLEICEILKKYSN